MGEGIPRCNHTGVLAYSMTLKKIVINVFRPDSGIIILSYRNSTCFLNFL